MTAVTELFPVTAFFCVKYDTILKHWSFFADNKGSIMFQKFGKANKRKLRKFTENIKLNLPDDYRKFLAKFNGGVFEGEYVGFCMRGERNSIYMSEMLGIGVENETDLGECYDEFAEILPENTIIIGDTIETGKILLNCLPEDGGIYLWDNDFVLERSNEEKCIYKIADSFDEFWGKLHKVA